MNNLQMFVGTRNVMVTRSLDFPQNQQLSSNMSTFLDLQSCFLSNQFSCFWSKQFCVHLATHLKTHKTKTLSNTLSFHVLYTCTYILTCTYMYIYVLNTLPVMQEPQRHSQCHTSTVSH